MTDAAVDETRLGAPETASPSAVAAGENRSSLDRSTAQDQPSASDEKTQMQALVEQQREQEPSPEVKKEGLVWQDITFDIALSRKARKAAIAASKDPSSDAEKGSLDTAPASGAKDKDTASKANEPGWRRILDHVSGSVRPGEMVAILGASGAGKTTLLNILSARVGSKGRLDGKVLFHGAKRNPGTWKRTLGYVEQDDLLHVSQAAALQKSPSFGSLTCCSHLSGPINRPRNTKLRRQAAPAQQALLPSSQRRARRRDDRHASLGEMQGYACRI